MNSGWFADADEPDLLENVYLDDEGAWRTCGGYTTVLSGAFTQVGPVHSLHHFTQRRGGRNFLVFEHEDTSTDTLTLAYVNYSSGAVTTLESGRTLIPGPNPGTTYWEHANWLWVLNGYDPPMRWNGREYIQAAFLQAPPAPSLAYAGYDLADADILSNPNEWDNGWQQGIGEATKRFLYGYGITWISDTGESPMSEIAWISGKNTAETVGLNVYNRGKQSVLVTLPRAPAHVRGVRLWRTVNTYGGAATVAATMYRVAEFGSGGELHHCDGTPDSELILTYDPDSHGLFPTRARYITMFKGCAFVDDGPVLRYSVAGFPGVMPDNNFLVLGDSRTGDITGMITALNSVVVFKTRGIYLVKGDPENGFYSQTVTEDEGNEAPRCILELPGRGITFMNGGGIKLLVGALENTGTPTSVQPLPGLSALWRQRVNKRALVAARAARYSHDREVWFQVPKDGDDRPGLGLVFHDGAGWSLRTDFPFSCLAESNDHQGHLYAGSHTTNAAAKIGVHVYTRGADQAGTAVASVFRSPWIGHMERGETRTVELFVLNHDRALTLDWHVERDIASWTGPSDTTREHRDYERSRTLWGESGTWEGLAPTRLRVSIYPDAAFEFQFRVQSAKMALLGYVADTVHPHKRPKREPGV